MDDFAYTKWNETRGAQILPGYCCQEANLINGIVLSFDTCATRPTTENSYYTEVIVTNKYLNYYSLEYSKHYLK